MHLLDGRKNFGVTQIKFGHHKSNKKTALQNTWSYLTFGSPVALRPEILNE
jgi:hypothetical protein